MKTLIKNLLSKLSEIFGPPKFQSEIDGVLKTTVDTFELIIKIIDEDQEKNRNEKIKK